MTCIYIYRIIYIYVCISLINVTYDIRVSFMYTQTDKILYIGRYIHICLHIYWIRLQEICFICFDIYIYMWIPLDIIDKHVSVRTSVVVSVRGGLKSHVIYPSCNSRSESRIWKLYGWKMKFFLMGPSALASGFGLGLRCELVGFREGKPPLARRMIPGSWLADVVRIYTSAQVNTNQP